jgi:F-type H+-transporting ATPase subunit b
VTLVLLASGGWTQALVVQLLGFTLLVVLLVKLVAPALGKILGGRTKGIEETFSKLEKENADTARELAEIKAKLAAIDQEAKRRHEASKVDAEKTRAQALADAAQQAQTILDKARREIQTEGDKAVLELRQEAEQLTLAAAEHLTQSVMNDAIQQKLVDGYLGKIEGANRL